MKNATFGGITFVISSCLFVIRLLLWLFLLATTTLVLWSVTGYAQTCTPISSTPVQGTIRGAGVQCYTFSGVAGEAVTIRMEAVGASTLDPLLELLAPNGAILATDDDSAGGRNSLIQYELPATGTYTIRARSYGGSSSGDYHLTFTRGAVSIRCVCGSDTYNGIGNVVATVLRADSGCSCSFAASAGNTVSIRMLAKSANLDPYIELYGPNGRLLAFDDDSAGNRNSLINQLLNTAGTYTVIATSYGQSSYGDFTLSITGATQVASPTASASAACGGAIQYGASTTGSIARTGSACRYQFSGRDGDVAVIRLETLSDSLDPWLQLISPNGSLLFEDDDSSGGRNSLIRMRLPSSGTYTIVATSYQGQSAGPFRLTLTKN